MRRRAKRRGALNCGPVADILISYLVPYSYGDHGSGGNYDLNAGELHYYFAAHGASAHPLGRQREMTTGSDDGSAQSNTVSAAIRILPCRQSRDAGLLVFGWTQQLVTLTNGLLKKFRGGATINSIEFLKVVDRQVPCAID